MLKSGGFSLLEVLISLLLSSIMMIGIMAYYPHLYRQINYYYQHYRLKNIMQNALVGLSKDIKRAGFIANDPQKIQLKALEINSTGSCIMIRYDSEIRGDWVYLPYSPKDSDLFVYRYYKNNLEYKTGALDCAGSNWEKIVDPDEIKIVRFTIKMLHHLVLIDFMAALKNNPTVTYSLTQIIKNENLL